MQNEQTNILVIGSGLAGAIAALTAAEEGKEVILITKNTQLLSGNTAWAQGGIAHFNPQDSHQLFKQDIINAGHKHNYEPAVDQLVREGPKLIEDLLINKYKVPFETDTKGHLVFTAEAAHSIDRIVHYKDTTGSMIHNQVLKQVKAHSKITTYTNHTAVDLLTYSHHSVESVDIYKKPSCYGAVVLNNQNQTISMICADKTILATGGLGQIYLHTTNPPESRGDGIAMAWRAGARCFNLQYIQFHPTALFHKSGRFLISEALRGEGAQLLDVNGREFMKDIHKLML